MRNPLDPRHKKRKIILENLFRYDFHKQRVDVQTKKIVDRISDIDSVIIEIAPEFPVEKINKVDLAILRLAIYELKFEKETPPKVVLDEAIELAKEYAGENDPAFINGALGKLVEAI